MVQINYICGTVDKIDELRFKKMIFRSTRGKALTYFQDIDPNDLREYTGKAKQQIKTVYVIIF